ncbi:hypothetical protein [Noviluteimonas gilva]|uniref:Uncharacterized protein n=1 Tax=Noviluteimonas gilva TaxID=2682097 RepID=A0A7C9HMW9_9GAMM|nr:hypothetical protein [Lysobacter gilvus]MUV14576.1 hypothetical protein [Lysobacter gilvus]
MADAAIDNDALLKGVSYGFIDDLLASIPGAPFDYGVLGTAKYVLPKVLKKRPPVRVEEAKSDLSTALESLEILEPTPDETLLAAQLEYEAQLLSLPMHVGECQLIAILVVRALNHVLTGDKAALVAVGPVASAAGIDPAKLSGKFICFEQAVRFLMSSKGAAPIKSAICAERDVDIAMRVCFSCASPEVEKESWLACLESHIEDLRSHSGDILVA